MCVCTCRPLVDFTTCALLVPVLLLGTILGVFFNAVAPGWLISALLVLALVYTTYRTALKARRPLSLSLSLSLSVCV